MGQRRPSVREGLLHLCSDDTTLAPAISLHSPSWFTWLQGHSIFVYELPFLHFTARKERRAGGAYWYAYRRRGGKLHTAYLGKSDELTLERLSTVATGMQQVENATRMPAAMPSATPTAMPTHHTATPSTTDFDAPSAPHLRPTLQPCIQPPPGLPVPLTPLIGREVDAARAAALLCRPSVRLLSLVGRGGIGKTRLALQVAAEIAERFADGVYLVPLAEVRDPQMVLPVVARALGIKAEPGTSVAEMLKAVLKQKLLLLVLDNFEQLMPAASYLVDLLTACPMLKLMVTSREVLHLCGEQPFPVGPLEFPDLAHPAPADLLRHCPSVSLFLQRAEAVAPGIAASPATIRAVAQICARLEGLPLAIELAAARVKLLPPQALITRLERKLEVLTGGGADMAERHKSLRATFIWSHDLLTAEEQSLFRRLAIFAGGCTLEAAHGVCNASGDLTSPFLDLISSLVDKNMLQTDRREAQPSRIYMLDTVREYALECLLGSGELQSLRKAHAAYYSGYLLRAWPWGEGDTPGQEHTANCSAREDTSMLRTLPAYAPLCSSQGESRPAGLTNRELEALLLLAEGLSNDQIACRLVISTATVKTYLSAIYNKLGVSSRTAAMRFVIDHLHGAHAASLPRPQADALSSHAS